LTKQVLHRLDWEAVGKLPNKIPVWQAWALTVTWNYILSSAFLVLQFPPFHAAPPKLDDCAWHQPTTSLGSKTVPLTSSFSHLFQLPSFDDFPSLPACRPALPRRFVVVVVVVLLLLPTEGLLYGKDRTGQ